MNISSIIVGNCLLKTVIPAHFLLTFLGDLFIFIFYN